MPSAPFSKPSLHEHTFRHAPVQVKTRICGFAVSHGNDGVRLNAVKFLELTVLLLTSDVPRPHALLQPGMVSHDKAMNLVACSQRAASQHQRMA